MNLQDLNKELLKNPANKKEFERYDLAFEISQMLIEARIIKGMTQAKLATLIKTKQSGIARAENGTVLPKLSFLKKIADAIHARLIVTFDFMNGKDVAFSEQNSAKQSTQVVYAYPPQINTPSYLAYAYQDSKQEGLPL